MKTVLLAYKMTKQEKTQAISDLAEKFKETSNFYFADASGLSVAQINDFRRICFEKGVEYNVYKNTLIKLTDWSV